MELRMPTLDLPWTRKTPLQKTQNELQKLQHRIQKQVSKIDLPKIELPKLERRDMDAAVSETRKAVANGIEQAAAQLAVGAETIGREADELSRDAGKEAAKLTREAAKIARQASKEAAKLSKEAGRKGAEVSRELAISGEENLRALGSDLRALGDEVRELRVTRQKRGPNMLPGVALLAGLGSGLAAMYFFDPEQGRRRRALLRDQLVKWTRIGSETAEGRAKDLRNRAMGAAHEVRKAAGVGKGQGQEMQQGSSASTASPWSSEGEPVATHAGEGEQVYGATGEAGSNWDRDLSVPEAREGQPDLATGDVQRTSLETGEER